MTNILKLITEKKSIDDGWSCIFPKQKDRNLHNKKYQETYENRRHVLSTLYI